MAKTVEKPRKKRKRKKGQLLPKTRSFRECERRKWTVGEVESSIPGTFWKRDYLGVADLIACHPDIGILAIQALSDGGRRDGSDRAAHRAKAEASAPLRVWLRSGGFFELWCWGERNDGARGEEKVMRLLRLRAFLSDGRIGWAEVGGDVAP